MTSSFNLSIDRSLVDNALMDKRIRLWINKKIVEYIEEEEPALVDFSCSKVLTGSAAMSIPTEDARKEHEAYERKNLERKLREKEAA